MNQIRLEERIKTYLKRVGLSQAAVARRLNYSPNQFNKWIRGVNRIPDRVILEFSDLLTLTDEEKQELFSLAGYVAVTDIKSRFQNVQGSNEIIVSCSLCGRSANDAEHLIEVKEGAYICAECATESIESFTQKGVYIRITRSIEFAPEYHQAGVAILNYFGTVLREKYADLRAKVRIEQEELKVTLVVESPTGERDKIEKVLTEYGLVVLGKMTPEEFFDGDALKIFELRQHLQVARLHIESQREMLRIKDVQYGQHIQSLNLQMQSLEKQVNWLHSHVGNLLTHSAINIESFKQIALESLSLAGQRNEVVESAVKILIQKLEAGVTEEDEEEVKGALDEIKKEDPILFDKIKKMLLELLVKGSIAGASGNLLYEWLKWLF